MLILSSMETGLGKRQAAPRTHTTRYGSSVGAPARTLANAMGGKVFCAAGVLEAELHDAARAGQRVRPA